jgi:hypothetical protein
VIQDVLYVFDFYALKEMEVNSVFLFYLHVAVREASVTQNEIWYAFYVWLILMMAEVAVNYF